MAWRYSRYTRRFLQSTICLIGIFTLLHSFQLLDLSKRRYDTWDWTPCPESSTLSQTCIDSGFKILQDVQIIVKTGGTEPRSRLSRQLATMLSQIPPENILVFSDLEEHVGGMHVQDVYADISERERANYPEFALYDLQQDFKQAGKDTRKLRGGWDLAK